MAKTVLIVEDDKDIREPMRELLERRSYKVECAATAERPCNCFSRTISIRVLCDLMMPNMNGIELIEALERQNLKAAESIVILAPPLTPNGPPWSWGRFFTKTNRHRCLLDMFIDIVLRPLALLKEGL